MKEDTKRKNQVKQIISEVNSRLSVYDPGFISLKRFSEGEKERVTTFSQFIECKINMEMYLGFPELSQYIEMFDGHLFEVKEIKDPDEEKESSIQQRSLLHPPEITTWEIRK